MNELDWPILSLVTFTPLIGALGILMIRGEEAEVARNARHTALWTSVVVFILSLFLVINFDYGTSDFQFVERAEWLPSFGIAYHMGVDGVSVW